VPEIKGIGASPWWAAHLEKGRQWELLKEKQALLLGKRCIPGDAVQLG
jgi:hypothetical protein